MSVELRAALTRLGDRLPATTATTPANPTPLRIVGANPTAGGDTTQAVLADWGASGGVSSVSEAGRHLASPAPAGIGVGIQDDFRGSDLLAGNERHPFHAVAFNVLLHYIRVLFESTSRGLFTL